MDRIKSLIVLAVALIPAGVLALALVNLNHYWIGHKERLIGEMEQRVGTRVSIGEISMTLWGGVGMRLDKISLRGAAALASGSLLRADSAQVTVSLLPLLWNELRIKSVSFQKPVLTVRRDGQGRFDAPLPARNRFADPVVRRVALAEMGDASTAPLRLHEALLRLLRGSTAEFYDGEVRFADASGNIRIVARNVTARLDALQPDQAVPVEITAAVLEAEQPNVYLRGLVGPWPRESGSRALPVSGRIEADDLSLRALMRLLSGAVRLPSGLIADGAAALAIEWRGTVEHLVVKGMLNATRGLIAAEKCCVKRPGIPLLLAVEAHVTESRIAIRRARIELDAMAFEAIGEIDRWMPLSMRLTIDSEPIKLARLKALIPSLRRYGLTGYAKLHSQVGGELGEGKQPRVSGLLSFREVKFKLPKLGAAIKGSQVRIFIARKGSNASPGSPSAITYHFYAPELQLVDLAARTAFGTDPQILKDARSAGTLDPSGESPIGRAEVSSAEGTLSQLKYAQLWGAIRMADDVLSVERFRIQVMDGSIEGAGAYRFAESPCRFRMTGRGQKLNLASLRYASLKGSGKEMRGRLDLNFDVDGRIQNGAPAATVLSAEGEARVTAGVIPYVNLAEEVIANANGLENLSWLLSYEVRKKYPQIFRAKSTRFEKLQASFNLEDGKLRVNDFSLTGANYLTRGKGWVDARGNVDLNAVLGVSDGLAADLAYDLGDIPFAAADGYAWIPFSLAGAFPRLHSDALTSALPTEAHRWKLARSRADAVR